MRHFIFSVSLLMATSFSTAYANSHNLNNGSVSCHVASQDLQSVMPYSLITSEDGSSVIWFGEASEYASANYVEEDILEVTSDGMKDGAMNLKALTDNSGSMLGLKVVTQGETSSFDLGQLASGVVFYKTHGIEIIRVKSQNFTVGAGGVINMSYLTNAITKEYRQFSMDLYHPNGRWLLKTTDGSGREFTKMFLKMRTVLGQPIGIEDVIVK